MPRDPGISLNLSHSSAQSGSESDAWRRRTVLENSMLGVIGVVGLMALTASDLLLVWSPDRNLDVFRAAADKTNERVFGGVVLGVFSIPLVLVGVAYLWRGLAPAGVWLAAPPLLLTGFAYVVGAGFHALIGPFLLAIRDAGATTAAGSPLLQQMYRQFHMLRTGLWLSILAASLALLVVLLSGQTLYPRWVAAVSPFPVLVAFRIVARVAPPAVAGALVPAGGNLATLSFLVISLAVLP
jgi:hypothetical protein